MYEDMYTNMKYEYDVKMHNSIIFPIFFHLLDTKT